jgi:phosphohistidine phosphatase
MDLYIIRHAWAGDRGDPQWPDDRLRPLTESGQKRFAKLAAKLVKHGMTPEVIATSPLLRCVQTAEILAGETAAKPEIVELDALQPGSDLVELMRWTTRQVVGHRRMAWVGHSPDVERLTGSLIGASEGLIRFAKGGVAAIRFDGPLEVGAGELRWLVTAGVLGC